MPFVEMLLSMICARIYCFLLC